MSKITIKLEYEQIDAIILKELTNVLKCIEKNKKRSDQDIGYHHPDDVKQYPKDIKALKRVIKMFTVQNTYTPTDEAHIRG